MILDKMQFLLGFCFSPPIHSTEEELETYYLAGVKPFLSVAYQFPDVPMTLFFSGPLLQWLQDRHSEYLTALTEMIKRKQVEVLGGGYYAPLLPLIPPTDRLGQIEELTTLVRKLLGRRPRGLWLTKGVWDPALVVHLTGSGMEYTFLEESEFRRVGLSSQQVGLPRLTEHQGRLLTIFPYHQDLALKVQAGDFEPFLSIVPSRRRKDRQLLSLFLSVETPEEGAFFTRPERGLEEFLQLVRSFYPEIEAVTASSFLKKNQQALERSYFSGTTYDELCRRTGLPARPSSGSQSWKQFLAHDEAANQLYNKMVYVHLLVSSLRGDKYKKKSAYDDLWKAQNWLGFLGTSDDVALSRQRAFGALLNAEVLLRDKILFQPSLTSQDFDLDGVKEYLFQGKLSNFYIDPVGGQVFEWDVLDRPWNYIGTPVAISEGTPAQAFVDRFFRTDRPDADAGTFFEREYRLVELNRERRSFQLMVVDGIEGTQGRQPLRLKKSFTFGQDDSLVVEYELELLTGPSWEGWFSSEVCLTYSDLSEVTGGPLGPEIQSEGYQIVDSGKKIAQSWAWAPEATVSWTGGTLAPRWWLVLHPGETWKSQVTLALRRED